MKIPNFAIDVQDIPRHIALDFCHRLCSLRDSSLFSTDKPVPHNTKYLVWFKGDVVAYPYDDLANIPVLPISEFNKIVFFNETQIPEPVLRPIPVAPTQGGRAFVTADWAITEDDIAGDAHGLEED